MPSPYPPLSKLPTMPGVEALTPWHALAITGVGALGAYALVLGVLALLDRRSQASVAAARHRPAGDLRESDPSA